MSIALIAAVAKNNVIGKKGAMPWYLPEDLKRFKKITTGHVVLMGRKTFESILEHLGKPLPDRTNFVITRDDSYQVPEGVVVYTDLEKALSDYQDQDLYVIGGGEIFSQTFDRADKLYITHIDKEYDGDVFFPEIDPSVWQKAAEEKHEGFEFAEYVKK